MLMLFFSSERKESENEGKNMSENQHNIHSFFMLFFFAEKKPVVSFFFHFFISSRFYLFRLCLIYSYFCSLSCSLAFPSKSLPFESGYKVALCVYTHGHTSLRTFDILEVH